MILDLFAAGGGWDEGIRNSGRTDVIGIEWDRDAVDTAEAAGHQRIHADIETINPNDFSNVDTIVGSPPCQGFSLAGKQEGRTDAEQILHDLKEGFSTKKDWLKDPRSHLVLEPLRFISAIMPDFIGLEQVPMVLPLWEEYARVLKKFGYQTWVGYIHAEQFGVPQTRKRAYLLASVHGQPTPQPTHSKFNNRKTHIFDHDQKWISMADALGWDKNDMIGFPRAADGLDAGEIYRERDLRPATKPSFAVTSKSRSWERFIKFEEGNNEWPWKRPSPTIVGSFRPDIVAAPGYRKAGDGPRQTQAGSVRVTQQEASVLQSFPEDYPWQGSRTSQFRQIGDAVPPLVAQRMVETLWATQ